VRLQLAILHHTRLSGQTSHLEPLFLIALIIQSIAGLTHGLPLGALAFLVLVWSDVTLLLLFLLLFIFVIHGLSASPVQLCVSGLEFMLGHLFLEDESSVLLSFLEDCLELLLRLSELLVCLACLRIFGTQIDHVEIQFNSTD
jgi:hypothetical protein